jgi:sugar/nucleoside kinase (ribokinase family)
MKKVLTIGGATQDIFIHVENIKTATLHNGVHSVPRAALATPSEKSFIMLQEGSKIEVSAIDYSTGGGATNSAVSFKRLGFEVGTIIKLGNDLPARAIITMLKTEGTITEHIIRSYKNATGISYVLPTPSGDRTILAFRGINAQVNPGDIPLNAIKNYNQLYITSLSGESSQLLLPITRQAKKQRIPVATNPGSSQLAAGADTLREALPNIDILILNADEAKILMASLLQTSETLLKEIKHEQEEPNPELPELLGYHISYNTICFSLRHFFKEVLRYGPNIVVVTNGAEGVYVATQNTLFFHPSLKVKIVNTIGAGDAFGSCFVASIMQGNPIEEALVKGIINAASVISYLDAKEGLLLQKKLEQLIKATDPKLLQSFPL